MDKLVELFTEAIRLRLKGDVIQARQMFQQYEEQATLLGMFPPQHLLFRHLLFEANLSSAEEMWESSAKVLEESLKMCKSDDQMMDRLEVLISLTQAHIYLKRPNKASLYLEQSQELLARFEQGELAVQFNEWEPVIFHAKRQQIKSLFHQIASLTDNSPNQHS